MGEPLPSTTVWGLRVVRFAFVMDLARRADTRTLAMQTGTSDRDEAIGIIRRFLDEDVEAIREEARDQGAKAEAALCRCNDLCPVHDVSDPQPEDPADSGLRWVEHRVHRDSTP